MLLGKQPNLLRLLITSILIVVSSSSCSQRPAFKLYDGVSTSTSIGPDPLFGYQWFLGGQSISATLDIKASTVWAAGNMGQGVSIAVVDPSSIYLSHADLTENKDLAKSYNFLIPTRGTNTTLVENESHGTCVAGVIAAKDNNTKGVRGVASRALLSARTTSGNDTDVFDALTYKYAETDVSSNSYGPPDYTGELNQYYTLDIFDQGILGGLASGRGGLGTVYVWAGGNGRQYSDRSNYDGYASHYGVMGICSVDHQGDVSFFSEPGSNLWICAPGEDIPTTDYQGLDCSDGSNVGWDDFSDANYTRNFTGTSASAPVVSGVVGLILREAKLRQKNLGWRDVKLILAESATKPSTVTWQPTQLQFNDDYGFGIVNAEAAVALVSTWTPLGNSVWTSQTLGTGYLGPTGSSTLDDTVAGAWLPMNNFVVDNNQAENGTNIFNSTISYLEYVTLEVKLSHMEPGDLEILLQKTPIAGGAAATSTISEVHSCHNQNGTVVSCTAAVNTIYEFGVANFLGESAQGTWELKIRDGRSNSKTGSVIGWRLKLYGH